MDWKTRLNNWKNSPYLPEYLLKEIDSLNAKKLEDSFYKFLDFGTGGMRGEIGVGTNRINVMMIRRVTKALSELLIERGQQNRGVVIAYDNRHRSKEFAHETAKVLTNNKIKVYLSDFMRPTPIVSLMVRERQAAAGIMITASHNPSQYNGYKVYGEDGCQITLEYAEELTSRMDNFEHEELLSYPEIKLEYVEWIGEESDNLYLDKLRSVGINHDMIKVHGDIINLVYTPLHGTGKILVTRGLIENGFTNTTIVEEQADYDSNFSTVKLPNPEEQESFNLAIEKAKKVNADLILATDPDSDRVGVAVKHDGEYRLLNGNEMGVIIFNYLANNNDLSKFQYHLVKTIVSTDLSKKIAKKYNVIVDETLTGFKFIGEKIAEFEKSQNDNYLFGFEESCGYLVQPYVRDKDAIQATKIIAEIALFLKLQGKTLIDELNNIFDEFGYFKECLINQSFIGSEGMREMKTILSKLRENKPESIGEFKVIKTEDFLVGKSISQDGVESPLELPKSNVLKFYLSECEWIVIRPSGTEPKCKIYISVNASSSRDSLNKLSLVEKNFLDLLK